MSDRPTGREVQFAAHPHGEPQPGDFRVVEVENAPSAFIGLLDGANMGKMLVKLA